MSFIESGYYPPGAEYDSSAPYNEIEIPYIEVKANITQTLTINKTPVITNSYILHIDEEGDYKEFDYKNIKIDALEQILTPIKILEAIPNIYNELLNNIDAKYLSKLKIIAENCKKWRLDEEYAEIID